MKYKKKVQRLKDRQAWWDKQSDSFKRATTRPGDEDSLPRTSIEWIRVLIYYA